MTTTYGLGFDFARPHSRDARIARLDALATLQNADPDDGSDNGRVGGADQISQSAASDLSLFRYSARRRQRRLCTRNSLLAICARSPCQAASRSSYWPTIV